MMNEKSLEDAVEEDRRFTKAISPWQLLSSNPVSAMHRMVIIQMGLLVADLLMTLYVDQLRHVNVDVISAYLVQYIMLVGNTVILFVRFTHTYPFRAGIIRVLFKEFQPHLIFISLYHILMLACRSVGVQQVLKCHFSECDIWTPSYVGVYVLFRMGKLRVSSGGRWSKLGIIREDKIGVVNKDRLD
ncbi:hypothetical protein HK101_005486 [Irineochytrium annulatum]|nr:hypothetical protein HK101_005486 [Irineochytrium annulatum]